MTQEKDKDKKMATPTKPLDMNALFTATITEKGNFIRLRPEAIALLLGKNR